jgi:hypothetical protein
MFDTYGPFFLRTHDDAGIHRLYLDIRADRDKGLENAMGIYIIASKAAGGQWIPCYVGMTTRELGQRLKEHLVTRKFIDSGPLEIFLIALRDGGRFVELSELTEVQELVIAQLEHQLIDHCVRVHGHGSLINKKMWSPHQIHVPGFIDKGGKEREDPAAQELAKLLG